MPNQNPDLINLDYRENDQSIEEQVKNKIEILVQNYHQKKLTQQELIDGCVKYLSFIDPSLSDKVLPLDPRRSTLASKLAPAAQLDLSNFEIDLSDLKVDMKNKRQ